jgi:hypothetical protein
MQGLSLLKVKFQVSKCLRFFGGREENGLPFVAGVSYLRVISIFVVLSQSVNFTFIREGREGFV